MLDNVFLNTPPSEESATQMWGAGGQGCSAHVITPTMTWEFSAKPFIHLKVSSLTYSLTILPGGAEAA